MPRLVVHEVGPRDGLQMERATVPLAVKEAWIRGASAAGVDIVQVGSFVRPDAVPQMADTDALVRLLQGGGEPPRAVLSVLVLNEQGLERALACGVRMVCLGASASETHSRKNSGVGTQEALRRILALGRRAEHAGLVVQVSIQSAFGCGYEGRIDPIRVLDMARAYADAGFRRISLADTAGRATPTAVERLFDAVFRLGSDIECTCHFHDTYGLGIANVFAALRVGVTAFESSFAGLGGCPFTKLAAGNVATEDVVHAFQREGLRCDIDLARLIEVARAVAAHMGRDLPGRVYKAGLPRFQGEGAA